MAVPNANATTPSTGTFIGPLAGTARTYQLLINSNQLTSMVGTNLKGLTFRIPASVTSAWPAANVVFTDYDIYLSPSVAPQSRSLTFADNIAAPQVQIHSGSLTVPAMSFPVNPAWGHEIMFNTPYFYNGGHLLVEIRHSGQSSSRSTEALATTAPGYGTDFTACWGGGITATSGSQGNFSVVKLIADNTFSRTDNISSCGPYTWLNGISYTSNNNTATFLKLNPSGCDSLLTLNLNVNNVSTGIDTQVQCAPYTWIDGNVYTADNNAATWALQNSLGCDSIVTPQPDNKFQHWHR